MKKSRFWLLILTLILTVSVVAGCSGVKTSENSAKVEPPAADVNKQEVILATTTSTVDSGLLDVLKPAFEKESGYSLTIVSVGSGQAIAMAEKGTADVLLVHSPKEEKRITDAGVVVDRSLVMHNDFLLVGPAGDPAKIKGKKIGDAFKTIADQKALFISRGDKSGTNTKELGIWTKLNIKPAGEWYQQTGSGMGQTLNVAAEKDGYTITDRATYLAQKKNNKLEIMVEGDKELLNIYHVMMVNPSKFTKVNSAGGKAFSDFMLAPVTQEKIGKFGVEKYGQALFIPDAGKPEF